MRDRSAAPPPKALAPVTQRPSCTELQTRCRRQVRARWLWNAAQPCRLQMSVVMSTFQGAAKSKMGGRGGGGEEGHRSRSSRCEAEMQEMHLHKDLRLHMTLEGGRQQLKICNTVVTRTSTAGAADAHIL